MILAPVILLALSVVPASAADIPTLPQAFYGTVTINGSPAPVNTRIEVRGANVLTSISGNPIYTSASGNYGSPDASIPNLVAQGDISEGAVIHFYVNSVAADQTSTWHSGSLTRVDLTVIINNSTGIPTTATTTTTTPGVLPIKIIVDGEETTLSVNQTTENTWTVLAEVSANSADGQVEMVIPKDTTITMPSGEELTAISVAPVPTAEAPPPPPGALVIGTAYNCEPSGAAFNPPIELVFHYDYDGTDETELNVAFFNIATGEWVVVPCIVDPATNTIRAQVSHFTDFAVILPSTTPTPSTTPATTKTPATSTTPITPTTQTTTAVPASTTTTPSSSSTVASPTQTSSSSEAAKGTESSPWVWIGIVIAVVVIIAIASVMFIRKRKPGH
jgi:hypothetical protein